MGTVGSQSTASGLRERRRAVEERLAEIGPSTPRRSAPPEGRLGAGDANMRRVAAALEDLGPVFASFGRYLATRLDLISRRDSAALATIADRAAAMPEADVRS